MRRLAALGLAAMVAIPLMLSVNKKRVRVGHSTSMGRGPKGFSSISQTAYMLSRHFARQSRSAPITPVIALPFCAIMLAVVTAESYFNECIEIARIQKKMGKKRADVLRTANLDDKLNGLLKEITSRRWNRGANPYQSFRQLVELRNELVHYKPMMLSLGLFPNRTVEQIARKFPHEHLNRADWTVTVLTPDVADWATQTVRAVIEEFHGLIGSPDPWERPFPFGWCRD